MSPGGTTTTTTTTKEADGDSIYRRRRGAYLGYGCDPDASFAELPASPTGAAAAGKSITPPLAVTQQHTEPPRNFVIVNAEGEARTAQ